MKRIEVIEGGSGFFMGLIDEPPQGSVPIFQFVNARRVLRLNPRHPVKLGMAVRTLDTVKYLVGSLGDVQDVFDSFRLVEVTGTYKWEKRVKEIDQITMLEGDEEPRLEAMILGSYEPAATEMFDRQIRSSFETARLVTNRDVRVDDLIDGKRVSRADKMIGLTILTVG